MKTYRLFAAIALICLSAQSAEDVTDYRYPVPQEKQDSSLEQDLLEAEEIERQEEEFEEIETENKRLEELKENAEQPGLRQHE